MGLPIRINWLLNFRYLMLMAAGISMAIIAGIIEYRIVLDVPEEVTMAQLVKRGDDFRRIRITDPVYQVVRGESFLHWDIIPLQQQGDVQLIYLCQDRGSSTEIIAESTDEAFPRPARYDDLLQYIDKKFPGKKIVFEEYNEPNVWAGIGLILLGLLMTVVGYRRLRAPKTKEYV